MPSQQHHLNLCSQGTSIKMLFTGYLVVVAVGYMMALAQIMFTHGMADGEFGLSIDDIVYSYYGKRSGSVLESKLNGSMKVMAPDEERLKIIQWVKKGADHDTFKTEIRPIIDQRCITCHSPASGMTVPDFTVDQNLFERADVDTGATFSALTRVSHIHLFGISFIFMFVGLIFSLAAGVPKTLKSTAIVMPYIFLIVDIASWWLTKFSPGFAWLTIIGGGMMALAFGFMWIVSMYEMWIMPKIHEDDRDALLDE
ncbi:MAG: elongation factor-1 alpha [Gammaproteobacteria bacterium]